MAAMHTMGNSLRVTEGGMGAVHSVCSALQVADRGVAAVHSMSGALGMPDRDVASDDTVSGAVQVANRVADRGKAVGSMAAESYSVGGAMWAPLIVVAWPLIVGLSSVVAGIRLSCYQRCHCRQHHQAPRCCCCCLGHPSERCRMSRE
ncbi:hypothetical protein E2C01_081467 [Portunus trituberculatus]|uniref:Uncharacterized protein n=1 Tax=Portunus trituberculatus TaxID=210409 RepID=A0A5B7IWF7_PORTR|nr:hypothetical protein [Portunus trituberculatus]